MRPQSTQLPLSLEAEEWRAVVGYEGLYEVSDRGTVRRIKGGRGTRPGLVLKPYFRKAYPLAHLCRDGKHKSLPVHRAVAEAFLGPCPPGCEVNHKNGIKSDYRVTNLEWVTKGENLREAYRLRLKRPNPGAISGARNGQAKLSEAEVLQIRRMKDQATQTELGRRFGVHQTAISKILRGERRATA